MAQDYLVDEANERKQQLINDARMRRFNNIATNAMNNATN
jgi:vacuolar-type H+-ATPase subunit H